MNLLSKRMQKKVAERIAGFMFTVVVPCVVGLIFHLSPDIGWPIIAFSVLIGLAAFVYAGRSFKMWPTLLVVIGLILFVSGLVWNYMSHRTRTVSTASTSHVQNSSPSHTEFDPRAIISTMQFDYDYAIGSTLLGTPWKSGYAHSRVRINNASNLPYEDLEVILAPQYPVFFALFHSDFADCKITPHYDLSQGNQNIVPISRLYCAKLPANSNIMIDLITVVPKKSIMEGPSDLFISTRRVPEFVDVTLNFMVSGEPKHIQQKAEFKPIRIPAGSVSITETHVQ